MKTMKHYRQGDILIERIKGTTPKGSDAKEDGRCILAHGEATGHAHEIGSQTAILIRPEDAKAASDLILSLNEISDLVHQEHGTIKLPKGTYRIVRQREYSPEAIRNVMD